MKMPNMGNWTYDMWVAYMTETKLLNIAGYEELQAKNNNLRKALEFYGDSCDATETTPCGYEGNLCCMTARNALDKDLGT